MSKLIGVLTTDETKEKYKFHLESINKTITLNNNIIQYNNTIITKNNKKYSYMEYTHLPTL